MKTSAPDIAVTEVPAGSAAPPAAAAERLVSLDAFRGITIAAMTLVNNPGAWAHIYPPLAHAEWHGWTHTDLIFPFFLLIVGVSMPFSFAARRARLHSPQLLRHVFRRSAILILLGLFLNAFPFFRLDTLRIPGVLQRIGVCYLMASIIYLYTSRRVRVAATVFLLAGYWALMTLVPVPGHGAGDLGLEGNLAAFIDRSLLTGHMWKPTWDPEGLLSTLPAIATTLLGVFAGEWLLSNATRTRKVAGLLLGGLAGLALGMLWDPWFPINKNLWTSSYVLFTAGYGLIVLAVCLWLMDVRRWRRWAKPFVVFGTNAIALFVMSGLLSDILATWTVSLAGGRKLSLKAYIFETFFLPMARPVDASLLFALSYVLLWLGIMWIFHRRRIFLKI